MMMVSSLFLTGGISYQTSVMAAAVAVTAAATELERNTIYVVTTVHTNSTKNRIATPTIHGNMEFNT